MNRADNSNKKNWREWDGNQEEGVDKEEIRSVHTVDWEQWGPWTKRGAGKWGGLAADSQMLLSLSDKAVRWQEWGKRLSASHKGETCSEMDRSSLSLSNQYDWDLTSTQMQSCISACGWTPVLNPVKQEVHHPASYWTNWGKRPSYVKVLPREVWQNIGEHLNPLDLYCPRLAVKLLVEMTHLITYRCAGCRRSYPWTSVAVCRGCQQVQCKRCAEPSMCFFFFFFFWWGVFFMVWLEGAQYAVRISPMFWICISRYPLFSTSTPNRGACWLDSCLSA